MKTDRFDEEFRRKLLGLPADTDAGDVDRIFNYVSINRPSKPGSGWGKGLLYGTAGALLFSSLLFNYTQYHTSKQLHNSLDSLKQQVRLAQPKINEPLTAQTTDKQLVDQPDTVYITRYRDRTVVIPQQEPMAATPSETNGLSDRSGIKLYTKQYPPTDSVRAELPDSSGTLPLKAERADVSPSEASTETRLTRQTKEGVRPRAIPSKSGRVRSNQSSWSAGSKSEVQVVGLTPTSESTRTQALSRIRKPFDTVETNRSVSRLRSEENLARSDQPIQTPSGLFTNGRVVSELPELSSTPTQPLSKALPIEFLKSKSLPFTTLNRLLSRPFVLTPVQNQQASKRRFHIALPQVSIAKSTVWAGASVEAGHEQFGGSLLGEWRINPRWSVQAGARWLSIQGGNYFTANQFSARTNQDFRALYAPYVPQSYELLNIEQTYQLIQLPLSIAYHYPLGHDWALRMGIGTDIDLYALNRFTFDYRENSRSFEQGLYQATIPVNLLNNVTLSTGIERQWKRWLFRASPFISPQLKPVEYKPEELYWGARFQVLRRFGGR